MILLKNFTVYTPECIEYLYPAFYLKTEDGLDWYYHLTRFQSDTLKICFDAVGTIRMFSDKAVHLYPLGLSVTEVNKNDVPEGLNDSGAWAWDGEKIIPRQYTAAEHLAMAEKHQTAALLEVSKAITPLQYAVDLGDATEEELKRLEELKRCYIALNRLDLSSAPDINWTEMPL